MSVCMTRVEYNVLNMSSKRKEIGSEFWFEDSLPQAASDRDGVYVLSGRTAIDLIIQDILETRAVRNVHMPAWCCDSMIAPFVAHGFHIDFYDVRFDVQLDCRTESIENTEILYLTNYFGYENTIDLGIIKQFKTKGALVLYDRTHSFLMDCDPYLALADYSFASIRKWMGVIGGAVVEGVRDKELKECPYLTCKGTAMQMKQSYIAGDDSVDKQDFLRLYGEFGHHLTDDFCDYAMDDLSFAIYKASDMSAIKARRRENAKYLHEHLNLQFLAPFTDAVCPLFVPVLFDSKEKRDLVRKKLIEAEIYCPIHWSKPTLIPTDFEVNKIYDAELSLICDQRYGIHEMQRIIDTIQ